MRLQNKFLFLIMITFVNYVYCNAAIGSVLDVISIKNNIYKSTIILQCNEIPTYVIFVLNNPERIVLDLFKVSKTKQNVFPIRCRDNNLIKCVRIGIPSNNQSTRIVCDLNFASYIETVTQKKVGKNYHVVLSIIKKTIMTSDLNAQNAYPVLYHHQSQSDFDRHFINNQKQIKQKLFCDQNNVVINKCQKKIMRSSIIVAIDAGHGGQDPGATGYSGIHEKHITLSIAKKLKKLLDADPLFTPVMIRDGDYFLSVMERSELARQKGANVLISIHTDSAVNANIKGASVWILSSSRAKIEVVHWLKNKEKRSKLLGGIGNILTRYCNDPDLDYLVLDLQFGYAQRTGYNIAVQVLNQLKDISFLHKSTPEYSGFGVLRSPDIPSILVETGFISNAKEESRLKNSAYQEKIAQALYKGLRSYFLMISKEQIINSL